ncbi:MAG TPA: hemolysin III family protein [Rhizomicrobium sp.]|jgi:hemolysin III|nr:hemolysin III family protein [Rhizomicrobium sp.]
MSVSKTGREYSGTEHAVDAVIHVLGVLFAINGGLWLLFHVTGLNVVASVSVYCAGLFAMLTASALYNLWPHGNVRDWLRRFDHAAIFIMIAATYTPFAVNRLQAPASGTILSLIWAGATAGVVLKMLFPRRFEIASVTLYLVLGWLVVTVIKPLSLSLATMDFRLLLAGGLVYSAGVVFYLLERLPYHKAIWHGFVLVAVILHFTAIASEFATALP